MVEVFLLIVACLGFLPLTLLLSIRLNSLLAKFFADFYDIKSSEEIIRYASLGIFLFALYFFRWLALPIRDLAYLSMRSEFSRLPVSFVGYACVFALAFFSSYKNILKIFSGALRIYSSGFAISLIIINLSLYSGGSRLVSVAYAIVYILYENFFVFPLLFTGAALVNFSPQQFRRGYFIAALGFFGSTLGASVPSVASSAMILKLALLSFASIGFLFLPSFLVYLFSQSENEIIQNDLSARQPLDISHLTALFILVICSSALFHLFGLSLRPFFTSGEEGLFFSGVFAVLMNAMPLVFIVLAKKIIDICSSRRSFSSFCIFIMALAVTFLGSSCKLLVLLGYVLNVSLNLCFLIPAMHFFYSVASNSGKINRQFLILGLSFVFSEAVIYIVQKFELAFFILSYKFFLLGIITLVMFVLMSYLEQEYKARFI